VKYAPLLFITNTGFAAALVVSAVEAVDVVWDTVPEIAVPIPVPAGIPVPSPTLPVPPPAPGLVPRLEVDVDGLENPGGGDGRDGELTTVDVLPLLTAWQHTKTTIINTKTSI